MPPYSRSRARALAAHDAIVCGIVVELRAVLSPRAAGVLGAARPRPTVLRHESATVTVPVRGIIGACLAMAIGPPRGVYHLRPLAAYNAIVSRSVIKLTAIFSPRAALVVRTAFSSPLEVWHEGASMTVPVRVVVRARVTMAARPTRGVSHLRHLAARDAIIRGGVVELLAILAPSATGMVNAFGASPPVLRHEVAPMAIPVGRIICARLAVAVGPIEGVDDLRLLPADDAIARGVVVELSAICAPCAAGVMEVVCTGVLRTLHESAASAPSVPGVVGAGGSVSICPAPSVVDDYRRRRGHGRRGCPPSRGRSRRGWISRGRAPSRRLPRAVAV